jgi:hypothetical protein
MRLKTLVVLQKRAKAEEQRAAWLVAAARRRLQQRVAALQHLKQLVQQALHDAAALLKLSQLQAQMPQRSGPSGNPGDPFQAGLWRASFCAGDREAILSARLYLTQLSEAALRARQECLQAEQVLCEATERYAMARKESKKLRLLAERIEAEERQLQERRAQRDLDDSLLRSWLGSSSRRS